MLNSLIQKVEDSRLRLISYCSGFTERQALYRPTAEVWSVTDNIEHLVWAEWGGTSGIWKAIDGIKQGQPVWTGDAIHKGLHIEEIIAKTWQPKEKVPPPAAPKWGGPLSYWLAMFAGCKTVLQNLDKEMTGLDPEQVIYPHPISGPLNVIQRLEFLRFHIERHHEQIRNLRLDKNFPNSPD